MRYMIASDYDGTVKQNGEISAETKDAIREFRAKGHLFGIVTGRSYDICYDEFKKEAIFDFDFLVTHNGAAACDGNGNTLFSYPIQGDKPWGDTTLAEALMVKFLKETPYPCGVAFEKTRWNFHPDAYAGKPYDTQEFTDPRVLVDIREFVSAHAYCKTVEEAEVVMQDLKKEFSGVLNPLQNWSCIDVTAVGVDKAFGIKKLAEHLAIPKDHIWTVGDNYNDIPMLKAYHGCAIRSGVAEIREVSEYVCDGIADVVQIVLNQSK